jgi:hypothetical protein
VWLCEGALGAVVATLDVVVVAAPLAVVEVDVAALAIAAPPPTTAPVTARVTRSGLIFRTCHLLSIDVRPTMLANRVPPVGGG